MSKNHEVNVSTQPSFAPIRDRRGGPMDPVEPMHDIHQQQQYQQQQQQQPQLLIPQIDHQYDPRQLMEPLQQQTSNQSTRSTLSSQSYQSAESIDSNLSHEGQQQQQYNRGNDMLHGAGNGGVSPFLQPPQQYHHQQGPFSNPPQATTSSSLASASGHLALPQHSHEKPKSRRWSITGRFFEKRKSITEPFHVPGSLPNNLSSSYKSTNSNIVNDPVGKIGPQEELNPNFEGRVGDGSDVNNNSNNTDGNNNNGMHGYQPHPHYQGNQQGSNNNILSGTNMNSQGLTGKDSKNNSPPSSSNGSRRSSLVDLPKAFLSSLRRSSLSGSSDSSSSTATSSTSSIAGSGASNNMGGGMMQTFGIGTIAEECSEEAQVGSKIVMAIPKAPPQDTHAQYPLLKSILKKQLSDAILDGTPASNGNASSSTLGSVESSDRTINSETVHPMVEGAIEGLDINLLTPIDHRARLLTHSPVPNQQHLSHIEAANVTTLPGKTGPYNPNNYFDSISSSDNMTQPAQISSRGAAIPSDFTPGMQPNLYRNRGGEQEPGSVRQTMTQEDMLTEQMLSISPRAQDLAKQYYNVNPNQNSQTSQLSEPIAVTVATAMGVGRGGVGGNRRCINFHETVEIIPAYKKSEYNRQGDKYATFKILTPDMKSEIRDELNNYKMREMAVHVESMGNTAFH